MAAGKTSLSVEDFAKLPDDDLLHELDEGELLTMAPASDEHGGVEIEIARVLANFVKQHSLGRVYGSDTGFVLGPDTVRSPDAAFVRKARLSPTYHRTFFPGAPDLAVEVFSPSDSVPQLMRKVRQYLKAGSHTVWIVYPETKQVHVFEAAGPDRILHPGDVLEAPTLLPGFSVPVASLFE
jgi:Uma2 family endonuclease